MKKNKKKNKTLLKILKTGIRLNTKAPKTEIPKTVYNRNAKHKRKYSETDTSSFFYKQLPEFLCV